VNFLVDAQLPPRLAHFLRTAGHDVVHTSELPDANRTTDTEVARLADADDRVVVTKDRDFRSSHLLQSRPRRLLIVATANIRNDELIALFEQHLGAIVAALSEARFVELGLDQLIVHDDH
jgi:predicted nuclease of predicted toxin-antitoxin system